MVECPENMQNAMPLDMNCLNRLEKRNLPLLFASCDCHSFDAKDLCNPLHELWTWEMCRHSVLVFL